MRERGGSTPERILELFAMACALAVLAAWLPLEGRDATHRDEDAGEVEVFLVGSKGEGPEVAFRVTSVAAISESGVEIPLPAPSTEFVSTEARGRQVPFASGRLPAGLYRGLRLALQRTRTGAEPRAEDHVDIKVTTDFRLWPGDAASLELLWGLPGALRADGSLETAAFALQRPGAAVRSLTLYVVDGIGNRVVAVNRDSDRVFAMIPVGDAPTGLAFSPDGRRAYVANSGDDTVSILDPTDHRPVDLLTLKPGCQPLDLAVAERGRRLVVSCPGAQSLVVIDPLTNAVTGEVALSRPPGRLAPARDSRVVYAVIPEANQVVAVDVVRAELTGSAAVVEAEPRDIATDPTLGTVFVVHAKSPIVWVLGETLERQRRLQVGVTGEGITVDRPGGTLYLTGGQAGGVVAVDTRVGTIVRRLPVARARRVAVDPDGKKLYVTRGGDGGLVVVNKIAWRLLGTIPAGDGPGDLAVAP